MDRGSVLSVSRVRRRALVAGPLTAGLLAACGEGGATTARRTGTSTGASLIANPARNEWPERFWRATPAVQDAYVYALANRDVLQYMPCYCGCGSDGHGSNYDCYVQEARDDGSYLLEPMSFG